MDASDGLQLHVVAYTTLVDGPGVEFGATVRAHSRNTEPALFRLVVAHQPLRTTVRQRRGDEFVLVASAPQCDTPSAPLCVEVKQGHVLRSVLCGPLSYRSAGEDHPARQRSPPRLSIDTARPKQRRGAINPRRPASACSPIHASPADSMFADHALAVVRHSTAAKLPALYEVGAPRLVVVTSPGLMTREWTPDEMARRRRLVRFTRAVVGADVRLHCAPVSQAQYDAEKGARRPLDDEIVISCIRREDTGGCCVTSVNIIDLLEMLLTKSANEEFDAAEKGSIRRNLDNLKPTTVAKDKPVLERTWRTIVGFPEPKPFTIEKTVKVFEWSRLETALQQAFAKYGIYSADPARSGSMYTSSSSPTLSAPPVSSPTVQSYEQPFEGRPLEWHAYSTTDSGFLEPAEWTPPPVPAAQHTDYSMYDRSAHWPLHYPPL